MSPLDRKLRWLIAIRVLVVLSLALPYYLYQVNFPLEELSEAAPARAQTGSVLRMLVALTSLETLLYLVLYRLLHRRPEVQAYVQFCGDLLLITLLLYRLGEAAASFSILYLVVISVAAVLLRRSAAVVMATLATVLYTGVAVALHVDWPRLAVHMAGFYAVAILTSYLAHDVTRAEAELREKQHDLSYLQVVHRDVIQSISSGLVTTDLEGVVTSVNRMGERILGRTEGELVGRHLAESGIFTQEHWERIVQPAASHDKSRAELTAERDGGTVYIGFTHAPLRDGDGTQHGYIAIFQDLTEWKRLQEEVRLKDRLAAVGEMAAGLAHEVGNPLASISGAVQLLASSSEEDGHRRKLLDITLKESQRLDRTVKGFLQFARPRERNPCPFDVAALLAEDVALLRNSEEVQIHHRIEADLWPSRAEIFADPDQVGQIFWNLARNALKAMPDGGLLTISGRLVGDRYRLAFRDTGRGMSKKQREKLFHPFHSFFDGGTGIGMAIVYAIAEAHGGTVDVDTAPGRGTVITVELPVHGPPPPAFEEIATP